MMPPNRLPFSRARSRVRVSNVAIGASGALREAKRVGSDPSFEAGLEGPRTYNAPHGDDGRPFRAERHGGLEAGALRVEARAQGALLHHVGDRRRSALDARHRRGGLRARPRLPGRLSVHAGRLPVDVPGAALDDAAVRGLRHRGRDEPAVPLPDRARPDRALDRLRHAEPHGLRLGPPEVARRGRARGRRDRLARGHGAALRRDPARPGLHLDDDQRARRDPARLLHLRRRGAGRPAPTSCAGRSRRTSSRSTSRRRSGSSRRSRPCGSAST